MADCRQRQLQQNDSIQEATSDVNKQLLLFFDLLLTGSHCIGLHVVLVVVTQSSFFSLNGCKISLLK